MEYGADELERAASIKGYRRPADFACVPASFYEALYKFIAASVVLAAP